MTVTELITALKLMPPEAEVITEGCDCYGDAGPPILNEYGVVEITREY